MAVLKFDLSLALISNCLFKFCLKLSYLLLFAQNLILSLVDFFVLFLYFLIAELDTKFYFLHSKLALHFLLGNFKF